jgi:hypothetical protein
MVVSHVNQLVFRPDFETLAFDDIERAEKMLQRALARLQRARAEFGSKAVDA